MNFITRLVQLDVLFPYMRPKASIDLLRLLPGIHDGKIQHFLQLPFPFRNKDKKGGAKAEILSLINLRHCPRMEKNMMVGELPIRITDVC